MKERYSFTADGSPIKRSKGMEEQNPYKVGHDTHGCATLPQECEPMEESTTNGKTVMHRSFNGRSNIKGGQKLSLSPSSQR